MKKKTLITICSSVGVLALVATATFFAIFKDGQKAETSLSTGIIDVKLIETFEGTDGDTEDGTNPDGEGLTGAIKIITGENVGTQPAYVRVKIFPQIETYFAIEKYWDVFGGIPTNFIKYDIDNTNWTEKDGYLYYNKILPVGETTTPITITNLSLDIPNIYVKTAEDNSPLRANMLVEMEASQSSNELYKLNWNIDALPAEVEQ